MQKRMILMLVATGLVFGAIFGFKWLGSVVANNRIDNMPEPTATVSADQAQAASWVENVEAVGTLVAVNGADVTTEAPGVISAIRFESGQAVRKGDVLLQLDASTQTAALRSMQAAAELAVSQRDRYRQLFEQQLVSKAGLEERESQAISALADVTAQQVLVRQKTIRVPFDGLLGIRQVNLGQYLTPGDPIVGLQALDPIFVDFTLPEQRLSQVLEGMAVDVIVDARPGEHFKGRVIAVEPEVDVDTRNFAVRARLDNAEVKLRPGTSAQIRFDIGPSRDVVVVPQTAISYNPYGNSVYIVSEDREGIAPASDGAPGQLRATQRFVTTGATRGDLVAITEGLQAGELVATSGLLKLRSDTPVTVNNKIQPTAEAQPDPVNR